MAKKENKKNKKNATDNAAADANIPHSVSTGGVSGATMNIPPSVSGGNTVSIPQTNSKTKSKGKKNKKNSEQPLDYSQLTPEQITQMQMEQAIKESSDPASKLKKLKSPLSVKGCLLNLILLVLITLVIVFIVIAIWVDKFNFLTVAKDILDKYGITNFFVSIGNWFKGVFSGGA